MSRMKDYVGLLLWLYLDIENYEPSPDFRPLRGFVYFDKNVQTIKMYELDPYKVLFSSS